MRSNKLVGPFALVGAMGGGLFAHVLHGGAAFTGIVVATTALSAGCLGAVAERSRGDGSGVAVLGAPVAGVLNALLALVVDGVVHAAYFAERKNLTLAILGASILGALVSLLFVIPLLFVVRSAAAVHARAESTAWRSQRRRVWRVAAMAGLIAATFVPSPWSQFPALATIGLAILIGLIAFTDRDELTKVVDVGDGWRKHGAFRGRESLLDLGVGDERWVRTSGGETYRDEAADFVVWGDAATTRAILRESLRISAACTALAVACVVLRALLPT